MRQMRKQSKIQWALATLLLMLTGCEASDFSLDTYGSTPYEADIKYVRIDDASILQDESDTLFQVLDPERIEIRVKADADYSHVCPQFILTDGATILVKNEQGDYVDATGIALDFTKGAHHYLVVSPNGQSHHPYTLMLNSQTIPTRFHLDWSQLNDSTREADGTTWRKAVAHYHVWTEYGEQGENLMTWCTANPGYGISRVQTQPENYPTAPCEGPNGTPAVMLTTVETGNVARMMNIPIAAGNFFIGDFDVKNALRDPLTSTRFGKPFTRKPLKFRGWMAYEPGTDFRTREDHLAGKTSEASKLLSDSCQIYAVLYRNRDADGNRVQLDGTNIGNSPLVVGRADITPQLMAGTQGQWVEFETDFRYDGYPQPFDKSVLQGGGYNLAIVASSSQGGADFNGALGSRLKLDELEIVTDTDIE